MSWLRFFESPREAKTRLARERATERESRRERRILAEAHRRITKASDQEYASHQYAVYENHMALLKSIHREWAAMFDWRAAYVAAPPAQPVYTNADEQRVMHAIRSYSPGLIDKATGADIKRRQQLAAELEEAKASDAARNHNAYEAYKHAHASWEYTRKIAHGILSGDAHAYKPALDWLGAFDELDELECPVEVGACSTWLVEASIRVNTDDVVPAETLTLTATKKLTAKKMSAQKIADFYQDYVCGAVLRAGRETLAALPVSFALVHASTVMLNPSTGHQQLTPILSVAMPRGTMNGINWATVDASDSMKGFLHRMAFSKTKGMAPVEPIRPTDIQHA
jgi:hypothetical protein